LLETMADKKNNPMRELVVSRVGWVVGNVRGGGGRDGRQRAERQRKATRKQCDGF